MASRFMDLMLTPDVKAAQARYYGRSQSRPTTTGPDPLGPDEAAFIAELDSFYLASVNPEGWPYVQHRGGAKGFLKVLGPHELGFADLKGNRQLLTTGHVSRDARVCLFLMSYPLQARLKILGRAEVLSAQEHPELAKTLIPAGLERATERLFRIRVEAFDWNCPQHITRRFTEAEIQQAIRPLQARITELEAQLAQRM
ncbi:pyridoxamine 5'-phosphate oxidase family protein [Geothrix sp. PMB-07]|uniref:pyridoxamine 5'-phosphate oxidase family protein n=1 Tax=Geothrix sp. PMB-07 TaxID=3068640 RepID=UPI0027416C53|nr:pyridoxamine 5'-phosphate oxidase family protein [Geothrix sp. PMB-07]WLT31623.1 pyridoxamine 5'-phosphate oxidase family protein [Geothrix sp. PMB-07]